jgi:hypothetical protein
VFASSSSSSQSQDYNHDVMNHVRCLFCVIMMMWVGGGCGWKIHNRSRGDRDDERVRSWFLGVSHDVMFLDTENIHRR